MCRSGLGDLKIEFLHHKFHNAQLYNSILHKEALFHTFILTEMLKYSNMNIVSSITKCDLILLQFLIQSLCPI